MSGIVIYIGKRLIIVKMNYVGLYTKLYWILKYSIHLY